MLYRVPRRNEPPPDDGHPTPTSRVNTASSWLRSDARKARLAAGEFQAPRPAIPRRRPISSIDAEGGECYHHDRN
jgi:hypothetical protein